MKIRDSLAKEKFDKLLDWLDPDNDTAGGQYLKISEGLIRFFRAKGCSDPESLADETMDRVALKMDSLILSDESKIRVFYGFAKYVYLESLKGAKKVHFQLDDAISVKLGKTVEMEESWGSRDRPFTCLEECFAKIAEPDASMIRRYFANDKSEKVTARQNVADEMSITMENLRIRVFRIKDSLRKCVENCLAAR